MRANDRDLIRGGHYGQRSCEPHSKAEHMAAPTNAELVKITLANAEPSTHDPKRTSGECRENQEIIALGVSDLIHVKAGRQPGHYAARQKEKRRMSCGIGAIGQCLISSSTHYS